MESESLEQVEAGEQSEQTGRVFDFTGPVELFDGETKNVYYRLRRVALTANDAGALPDGKTYTEAQVVEILGEDYATGLVVDKKCCG